MVDPATSRPLHLAPAEIGRLFPFFIEVGGDGRILAVGHSLARICPAVTVGAVLQSVLEPIRPEQPFDLATLRSARAILCLIRERSTNLTLRGQWVTSPHDGAVFVGSPWLTDTADLSARQLRIEDFAIHDPAVDLLHILRSQTMATADLHRLTEKLTAQRAELKETNRRLTTQEADSRKLAFIAARTDNAVVLTNADGYAEWTNAGFTRLTGYEPAEVLGKRPGTLLQGPDTDPAKVAYMRDRIAARQGFTVELLNYHKSGRRYWVSIEVQPILNEAGEVTHFMAIESDITARRRSEANLRVQFSVSQILAGGTDFPAIASDLLRTIASDLEWDLAQLWRFNAALDRLELHASWSADPPLLDRFLTTANQPTLPADVGLPGLTWRTLQNQWVERIGDFPACPRSSAAHATGLASAVAFPLRLGTVRVGVIELMSRRPETSDPDRLHVLEAIGVQITQFIERADARAELQRRSEELAQLNLQLESANHAKDDFLASISHEIRTPLNGVIGTADALNASALDPRQREALATLTASANHLHSLLNDVLDFSRIEGGHLDLQPQPVLLQSLVDDITRIFQPIARQKRLLFHVDCPDCSNLAIHADATRVRQVLVNLLGNAFKFTDHGGVRFLLQCEETNRQVRLHFEIQDTGIGIPPEMASMLFKPFSQLDSNRTRASGGTGLGLAISRRLTELMHGVLDFDRTVQRGSRFFFEFTAPRAAPPVVQAAATGPLQADGDVLIVDDHDANATILTMLLRQLGLTAHHCASAESALAYCASHNPPVVLMDVHMPQIDGFEATRLIKRNLRPDQRRFPIIALTADARTEVRQACFDAGMDGFLSKPIRLAELRDTLTAFLPRNPNARPEPTTPASPPPRSSGPLPSPAPAVPAAAAASADFHGLDEDVLEAIFAQAGDEELRQEVAEMFASFWRDVLPALDQIEHAQSRGDTALGQGLCHRLRGMLGNYGFQRAAEQLARMENNAAAFQRQANLVALRTLLEVSHTELMRRYPYLEIAPG